MVELTDTELWLWLAVVVIGVAGLATVAWAAFRGLRERRQRTELEAELEDIVGREEIQVLRHRDFDAFVRKVNEIRASKGLQAVEADRLRAIQYNLMYALDESDF